MTIGVFLAVLASALLHATWNALIKGSVSKVGGSVILSMVGIGIGGAILMLRPPIDPESYPWLAASTCAHFGYMFFLSHAYDRGDLSRVYPIARGVAPMLVTLSGALFLADVLRGTEYLGVFVLGTGIVLMARGVFQLGEERRLLPFALGSAAATASYTIFDGMGARAGGDAVAYVAWLGVLNGITFTAGMVALRGRAVIPRGGRAWATGAVASVISYTAYAISVWAMTQAPIALVAALRETSILFAVLIGWLVFAERMDRWKAIACGLIVAGVVLTRL